MANTAALKKALLEELAKRLSGEGFTLKASEQALVRPAPGGREALHVAFIGSGDLEVTADVARRIDAIEDIVHDLSGEERDAAERARTYTVGAELGNLAGKGQRRWSLESAKVAAAAADGIVAEYRRVGRPYLDSLGTPGQLLAVLSRGEDDPDADNAIPFAEDRARVALAAAHLLGDREAFTRLAREMPAQIVDEDERDEVVAFAKRLAKLGGGSGAKPAAAPAGKAKPAAKAAPKAKPAAKAAPKAKKRS